MRDLSSPRGPVPLLALVAAALAAGPLSAFGQERGGNARTPPPISIRGLVLDRTTGEHLPDVAIRLVPPGDRPTLVQLSGSQGRFAFDSLPPGAYRIEFSRIGYGAVADSFRADAGVNLDITAELIPRAVALDPIVVTTQRRSRLDVSGFYDRRRSHPGHFITREQIEDRNVTFVSDLFRTIPSLRLTQLSGGRGAAVTGRGGCYPTYFLDGVRMAPSASPDEFIRAGDVEGIEVYGLASAPALFSDSRCGTVVIWSRDPGAPRDGRGGWRRLLVGVGLATGLILLAR